MWMLWTERNNIFFGGNPLSVVELVMQAKNDHMELKAAEVGCHRSASLPAPAVRWQPPQQGFLKLNVDAVGILKGTDGLQDSKIRLLVHKLKIRYEHVHRQI
ncbi:hypothetical protein L3X38_011234 [Prunus dulcis]|uniref:Uncharacterized protein n=1 Tax=Prunus dulcis TaxID=3755 RepID=A0AAD4ZFI5_PRUDU|nr:hypothetical protein L3X38_011234 [Prunus dulcis]